MVKKAEDNLLVDAPRVLDLTDEKGFLCARILADLGADVIKIERPGGDPCRNIGPFYHDIPEPEKSLYWFAYNANKRGITLNIETKDGQEIFNRLAKTAAFVIESFPPGHMDKLGLGYSALSEVNPGIIMTSVTPFGQTGPYRNFKASDLVCVGMSGWLYLSGDPDRAPVRIGFPQAYLIGGSEAAAASMIAYYYQQRTGRGQHVDLSIQQSLIWAQFNAPIFWELSRIIVRRDGAFRFGAGSNARCRQIWPCKDGFMSFNLFGGTMGATIMKGLTEWMDSEGMESGFLKDMTRKWDISNASQELIDQIEHPIARFFMAHSKRELLDGAVKRGILLSPVFTFKDIVEDEQLKLRDFWVKVEHPDLNTSLTYPGVPAKFSEASCEIRNPAPLIGQHNREIYQQELGLSAHEVTRLKQAGVI